MVAIACAPTAPQPDGEWEVTVTGVSTDCVDDQAQYEESFVYQLFFDGTGVQIEIEGEGYANGSIRGCNVDYESAIWLEEQDAGDFQWQITGHAIYQSSAGGCDLPDGVDWQGTETMTVIGSEDPSTPEGCSYEMTVVGAYNVQ